MLYIFNQDDKYQNIITEETGLIDTWFKDYQNHLIDEPFKFHVESDSDLLPLIKDENQVAFYDRDNRLRLMRIKGLHERSTSDGYIVEVKCEPSFLELYDHFVEDRRINNGTAQSALNAVLQGSRYTGNVTVDLGNQTTNFYWINGIDAIFKIIDVWGGALVDTITLDENNEIIERKIIIRQRLGADNGLLIEPDYNAESIERSTLSYPVTAMYGQGASLETDNGGYTRYITFEDVEWKVSNGDPVDKPKGQKWVGDPQALAQYGYLHNNQRKHRFGHFSNQDYETPEELLMATWLALQEAKHPEVNHESTINVDRPVSLGDTATIIDRNYNKPIEVQSQITGLEYDILEPDEQVKVVLGKYVDMNVEPWEKELDDIKQEVSKPRPTKPIDNSSYPDVKPGTPTNVQAIGSFQVIQLYWDYDSAVYVSHYEVYASKVKDFVPDSQYLIYRGRVSAFGHEVQTDEMWYYRIRAVNTRGTPSDYSNQASAASIRINTPDIMFGGIIADHLENNLDIAEKLAQNTIDRINEGPMQEITYTQQQIEATEEAILNQLNSQIGDVNSAINDLNATADSLKLRVDDTEDLLMQHGNKFTNIETEIDTIDGRISATITNVERIDNTVNSHSTTLTAHAGLINAKLDSLTYQQDKTGIVNRIESNETEIGLLSTGLELRVTKEEFEALSIGGRNLIIRNNELKNTWIGTSGSTSAGIGFATMLDKIPVKPGQVLTFSQDVDKADYFRWAWYDENEVFLDRTPDRRGVFQWTVPNNAHFIRVSYPMNSYPKLEKGNKPTDWSPAPEDIDNQFTVITNRVTTTETTLTAHAGLISAKAEKSEVYTKTEVNTRLNTKVETTVYNNKVGQLDVSINNITSRVSNTETNINGLTGEVNTAKSQIGQLEVKADQVDIRVSEIRTDLNKKANEYNVSFPFNESADYLILLCESNKNGSTNFAIGTLSGHRVSGHYSAGKVEVAFNNSSDGSKPTGYHEATDMHYTNSWSMVTCTYGGKSYIALRHNTGNQFGLWNTNCKFYGQIKSSGEMLKVIQTTAATNVKNFVSVGGVSSPILKAEASITTLAGEVSLKASQTSVNSLTGRMSTAETTLNLLPGQLNAKVNKNGVISEINATPEKIRIASKLIHLSGTSQIDDAVIGTAAIANAAIARAHLQNAIIQNAHIADATIEHTKIKSVNADKINVGILNGIDIQGSRFYSASRGEYMEVVGGVVKIARNDNSRIEITPDGITSYHANGSIRYQTTAQRTSSGAYGTVNTNVYMASNNGGELRVVDIASLPGDGNLNNYRYNDIRAKYIFANMLEANSAITDQTNIYLKPRGTGEVRVTAGGTTSTFLPVRANRFYGNSIDVNTQMTGVNNLYARPAASGELRVTVTDTTSTFLPVRASRMYANALDFNDEIANEVNMYIRPKSGGEVRFTSLNTTSSFVNIRGNRFFAQTLDINEELASNIVNLYVRPRSNGEVIISAVNTSSSYRPIRASAFNESSSREFKTNIEAYKESALEVINNLTVVNYNLKDDLANGINDLKIGFISEDSEAIATLDRKAIQTYKLSAYNTKAIQELDVKVYNIETRLDEKDLEMQYLKQKVQEYEKRIKQLEERAA